MRFSFIHAAYVCLACVALITALVYIALFQTPKQGQLTFAALDIGQGDALYIQSPTGVEILIDGGPDSSVLRELPKVMSYGDRTIDAVIATHPDADHIGGLVDVLPRYTVRAVIEPGIPDTTATSQAFERTIDEEKIPRIKAYRGMWLDLGAGARLDVLFPDFDVSTLPKDKTNDGCVVARLTYKKTSALFTCDASSEIEAYLIAISSSTELQSDLLKVGHHGSRYSSSNAFLDAVGASTAVVSVGAKNRYGHPTEETLARLEAHRMEIDRTDLEGTLVFVSNGERFINK